MSTATVEAPHARKGRPRNERIDAEIASAAIDVLAEVGFDLFSVEEVAHRAGVAKTTVYRRFPSRADLITGALQQLGEEDLALPSTGSVRERLVAVLTATRTSTPSSSRGRILTHALSSADPELIRLAFDRALATRHALIRDILAQGVTSGELRAGMDTDTVMAALVGPMVYLGLWRAVDSVARVRVEAVVDLLLSGMTRATDS